MAIFLQKLACRKNSIHFLTMAIFPYGNFPLDRFFLLRGLPYFELSILHVDSNKLPSTYFSKSKNVFVQMAPLKKNV